MSPKSSAPDAPPSTLTTFSAPRDAEVVDFTVTRPEVTLFEALTPLIRAWRRLVGVPILTAIVVVALSFLLPKRYTARSSFVAESGAVALSGSLASLAGLAGQMGIGGLGRGPSPNTFAEVLKSRELLSATLLSPFTLPDADGAARDSVRLLDILEIDGDTESERILEGVRVLEGRVSTQVGRTTEIVSLEVELEGAELAAAVANRMVQLLNQFNLERRQSQSREQRRFAGERMISAETELRTAEANLLRFLQANRRYQDSPLLQYEADRLQREVQLKQEIFLTLSRKFEEARIAEVQDTPVLTVIDAAVAPHKKSYPKRATLLIIAGLLTGIVMIVWVFCREYWQRAKIADPGGYLSLTSALESVPGRRRRG